MAEWWTYTLADFLMFSPRTWWRMVELHNRAWWPLHLLTLGLGVLLLVLAWRGRAMRAAALLLALAWGWVGWAFHWERHSTIHLAGPWFATAFGLQALLLLASSAWPERALPHPAMRAAGLALAAAAVLLYPLVGGAFGRPLAQAEVVGMAPEPTALATLGLVLAGALRGPRLLLAAVPVLDLLAAGAMLVAMRQSG